MSEPAPTPRSRSRGTATLAAVLGLALSGGGACGGPDSEGGSAAAETAAETAAEGADVEATSLLGAPLRAPELGDSLRSHREAQLDSARVWLEAEPDDPEALIWVGRRLAYLGRYRDAIATFSRGVRRYPTDARFYRHRGHRFITIRDFERAIADLERAAALIEGTEDRVEPDGLPNARGVPTSTLHFNIWYHLGLARYLSGDFERALDAYRRCLAVARNPDTRVAASHWLYMTLRRLHRPEEAADVLPPIHAGMDVIENHAYHRLLLTYRGEVDADSLWGAVTDDPSGSAVAYGVANWHLYEGRPEVARDAFRRIVAGAGWAGFGHIAAEAELARMGPHGEAAGGASPEGPEAAGR